MRFIKSQRSLDLLKTMRALPLDVIHFVQGEFRRIYEAYGQAQGEPVDAFHTDAHHCGHIVVLENGDDMEDLSMLGLAGGFRRNNMEFVERRFTGKRQIYRIVLLFDNEYVLTVIMEAGINNDRQLEAWLQDMAEFDEPLPPTGTTGEAAWEVPF